jgi:acyl-CoA dehydrogenase
MLGNRVIGQAMTPAHHELLAEARALLTPARVTAWQTEPGGAVGREAWVEMGAHGLLGAALPRAQGGRGLGILGSLVVADAVSQIQDGGVMLGLHVQGDVACQWLAGAPDESLRERFLPGVLRGELLACQCDTDPAGERESTAVRDGETLVLDARKAYVINGAAADLCFVGVRLDGRPTIVLVERDVPGVRVRLVYDKLGTRTVDSALVEFDGVRVPASQVVSRGGLGQILHWNAVMTRMRLLIAADACLMHRSLLEHIVAHAGCRQLGGRPLVSWPVNLHALARARADLELMEAGIADAYLRLQGRSGAMPEVAALKWFCVERATQLAELCCDLEGGAGYMLDSPSLRIYRQLRGLRMAGGSQTTMLTIGNHSLACRAELGLGSEGAGAVTR